MWRKKFKYWLKWTPVRWFRTEWLQRLWRLWENAIQMQSITKQTLPLLLDLSKVHSRLSNIHTFPSLSSYHLYTHRHTNICCRGISIRLWALVSCSYCKAEGLNETIIRTLKSRGPQMIRKERTREKIKRKRGWGWKSPTIEPIHCFKPLLRAYFGPGGSLCLWCVCECPEAG